MGKVFTVPSVIIIDTAAAVAQEDCFVWGQPVWPDVGVKKLPNVSKSCRNNFHISFIHKLIYFKIARKTPIFLGYFCKQICWQELSKVAQSGHTGWPTNAIRRDSFFIKWNKVTFTKSYHLLRKKTSEERTAEWASLKWCKSWSSFSTFLSSIWTGALDPIL